MSENALLDWAEHYLRARDVFERKIVSLERRTAGLLVTYKHRKLVVLCQHTFEINSVPTSGHVLLVVTQSVANFETLITNFSSLARNPDLTVAFVNPATAEKWLLKPHVHANVAHPESLRAGLQTLYETISVA